MNAPPKKRGRKPKGGQVTKQKLNNKNIECKPNIILHLKVQNLNKPTVKIDPYTYYT